MSRKIKLGPLYKNDGTTIDAVSGGSGPPYDDTRIKAEINALKDKINKIGGNFTDSSYATPQSYGAVGDGVHDDSAGLKAALESGKPVRMISNLYIKKPVTIRNTDAILDGCGYTLYQDFTGDRDWYTGLLFMASNQGAPNSKTTLRVLTSNRHYDTKDYTGDDGGGGNSDYGYGYVSYKDQDPLHETAFLDWNLGDEYTTYYYEEHRAEVRNLIIRAKNAAGHIGIGFSQLCHSVMDNVQVYIEDGDSQGAIRIFRCYNTTVQNCYVEGAAPMTTYNTVGDAGYGISIDGDRISVLNCGGWNNKDELCLGGDRGCWSTNIIVDGFYCGCEDDPTLKRGDGNYRYADRFNCHSAVKNPTIKNVYCHIKNPSGRGIEAFAIRCPEVTMENIHIDTDQWGALIRFYEIVEKVHIKGLYAPLITLQTSTLNPVMFSHLDIDGGVLYRILNANYRTELHLSHMTIVQFIDTVQRVWMDDCTIECSTGEWGSPVALNVTEEAWLSNCILYSNSSKYIGPYTPIIKAPENSVHAVNCKFYKRLNRNTTINQQKYMVNCAEYDIAEFRLTSQGALDEYNLA